MDRERYRSPYSSPVGRRDPRVLSGEELARLNPYIRDVSPDVDVKALLDHAMATGCDFGIIVGSAMNPEGGKVESGHIILGRTLSRIFLAPTSLTRAEWVKYADIMFCKLDVPEPEPSGPEDATPPPLPPAAVSLEQGV